MITSFGKEPIARLTVCLLSLSFYLNFCYFPFWYMYRGHGFRSDCIISWSLLPLYLSRVMRKSTFWFPTWSNTNQDEQLQMARGLKFWIWKVEGLYYLCSENKGADQLRGYREADLRLCFRYICKMLGFSCRGSFASRFVASNRHVYHNSSKTDNRIT